MMKTLFKLIIVCFSIFFSTAGFSQQIFFKMDNPRIYYDAGSSKYYYRYDLFVRASVAGSYLYSTQQAYNIVNATTKFVVSSPPQVDISTGILAGNYSGSPRYVVNSANWVSGSPYRVFSVITVNTALNGYNPNVACAEVTTTFQKFATVSLELAAGVPAGVLEMTFRYSTMTASAVQKYALNPLPTNGNYTCQSTAPSSFEGYDFSNLYYARIYDDVYGWTQYGVNASPWVDWSAAVNTSVWDSAAATATINTTGSKTNILRIHPGARLKINPGKDLTCTGNAELNGPSALWIESDATGTGSFIDNGTITYPSSGSSTVERYLSACDVGLPSQGCWHYVSIPITSAMAGVFDGDYMKSYDEVTGTWSPYYTHSGTLLNVMQGYAVSRPSTNVDTKYFTGTLNTAVGAKSLTRNDGTGYGYNLVGNPYPSPVDLESGSITWTDVEAKVWYYSKYNKIYKPYVVGGPQETNPGTRYAPAMQGFFVHVPSALTGSLTIGNGARTATYDTTYYKNTTGTKDVLWLTSTGPTGMMDEAVIYFREDATGAYDASFDCSKLYGNEDALQLYSTTTDNALLTINALNYSGLNTVVPVDFTIFTSGASGNYTLTASKFESFESGTVITLEDKKEAKTQDLTDNPVYSFSYNDGDNPSRFLLHFYNPSFGIENKGTNTDLFIYSFGSDVYVKHLNGNMEKGEFFLYDMMGQKIATKQVNDLKLNKFVFDLPEGYYVAKVVTKSGTYNQKVFIE